MDNVSGLARFNELDNARSSFISDCEEYAKYTHPKVCSDEEDTDRGAKRGRHDYQAIGAQLSNHITNKLMLSLFAPSNPFLRIDVEDSVKQDLMSKLGITQPQLEEQFASSEKSCLKRLDALRSRPQLHNLLRHLVITGNALLYLRKGKPMRIYGIKKYVVKRNVEGEAIEILIRENVKFDELTTEVRSKVTRRPNDDSKVNYVKWLKRDDSGNWTQTHWVNDDHLPTLDNQFKADDMPYIPLVWDLGDEDDYGTGLVEEYSGDFYAISLLSQAEVEAAVLASEFRWLVNPAGFTSPEDFEQSKNGSAIPGSDGDVTPLRVDNVQSLQLIQSVNSAYINRLGRAFLMGSAVTRDAERVTAEEIKLQARELDTSLGGVYSRLATDLQLPIARFLIREIGVEIGKTKIDVVIITGLDALSRQADRDRMMAFLGDVTTLATIPPDIRMRIREDNVIADMAAAHGLLSSRYLVTEDEYKARVEQAQAQAAQAAASQAGAVASAEAQATQQ